MADIKSTMEMVLARAERLCAETNAEPSTDDLIQKGMKTGASIINGQTVNLNEIFLSLTANDTSNFVQGLLRTFYRYIQLPRDEGTPWEIALVALQQTAQELTLPLEAQTQLTGLLDELRSILGRYLQHRQQLEKQLEESFSLQAAQLQQTMSQQTGMRMKITPRQHPKFLEEWQRVQAQLNEQYTNAVEQYKATITSLFGVL